MQNITLLKEQTTNTESSPLNQLKSTLKQRSILSNQLHNQIQKHRKQIKELSDSVSKYIQKKLKPNQVKQRPKLFKQYKSPKLNHLQEQKNKIYRQISEAKQLIKQIKNQEEPETVVQYQKKQNILKDVQRTIEENRQDKKYLIHELNQNKQKIFQLNDNNNLKSTSQNEKILQQLRKQFKVYDKQAYHLNNQEIIHNMYYFQIKNALQKPIQPIKQAQQIDYNLINQKINEINQILQQRNKLQKQNHNKISQLQLKIQQLTQKNANAQHKIRQLQGKRLRKNMEHRIYKSRNSKSTSQINRVQKNYSSIKQKSSHKQNKNVNSPKINQFVTQIQDIDQKQELLQIGDLSINQFSTKLQDQIEDGKINRLTFLCNKKNIVGIKASYLTRKGLREGSMLSIKNLSTFTQVDINLNEIQSIGFPKNNKNMFIRFNKHQGTKQQFGLQYIDQPIRTVSMQNNFMTIIEMIVENNAQNSRIKGIKLAIQKNKQFFNPNYYQADEKLNEQSKAKSVADLHMSKVSSQSSNLNRKLVLGGLKKINEPKMDHRLLIGRKKLV